MVVGTLTYKWVKVDAQSSLSHQGLVKISRMLPFHLISYSSLIMGFCMGSTPKTLFHPFPISLVHSNICSSSTEPMDPPCGLKPRVGSEFRGRWTEAARNASARNAKP